MVRGRALPAVPASFALLAALVLIAGGCGTEEVPASEFGRRAFGDPNVSTSPFNVVSCATCHQVSATAPPLVAGEPRAGRIDPGYNLHDSVYRGAWWGGYQTRLLDAINTCIQDFMGGRALLESEDVARQLYEYLEANSPTNPALRSPLTVVKNVTDLAALTGDAARGEDVYSRACHRCHGSPHNGAGRVSSRASIIPEATMITFGQQARAVVVEKVRHGKFFSIGGQMPLYSAEAISDAEIADILTYLGL